jgi:hypothetical protein
MAKAPERPEEEPRPRRGWDYSRHPLKDGGMQILMVVGGCVLLLLGSIALLLWLLR